MVRTPFRFQVQLDVRIYCNLLKLNCLYSEISQVPVGAVRMIKQNRNQNTRNQNCSCCHYKGKQFQFRSELTTQIFVSSPQTLQMSRWLRSRLQQQR
jgi:hypothetical protein